MEIRKSRQQSHSLLHVQCDQQLAAGSSCKSHHLALGLPRATVNGTSVIESASETSMIPPWSGH